MYVLDRYSVKQPQNIIIKVKIKQHAIGKRIPEEKLNEIYIIAFIMSVVSVSCSAFYLHQEKLFS